MSAADSPGTETTALPDVPAVGRTRIARANGWWGTAIFVATETTLFGVLFGTYFYMRFNAVTWPPDGIAPPSTVVPLVLAGVLAVTSVPMQIASSVAQRGRARLAWWAVLCALVVQTGYFAMEAHLFSNDLATFSPQATAYGSIYYTLLGADHAHVFVGLLLNVWLLVRLTSGLTAYRVVGVQSITFYWHFVNLMTLFVTGAILSAAV